MLEHLKAVIFPHFFKRELGFWALLLLGIGSTIEGSIFILLTPGLKLSGEFLPFSFFIGGIFALFISMIYAEITTIYPQSGSILYGFYNSFGHKYWFFIISWLIILGDLSYFALNVLGFAMYVATILHIPVLMIAFLTLFAVTVVNLLSVKGASHVQSAMILVVLLGLVGFIVAALLNVDPIALEHSLNFTKLSNLVAILSGTALIFSAFIGYEDINAVAGEVKNPSVNIPKALIVTVAVSSLIYIVLSFIVVRSLPIAVATQTATPLFMISDMAHIPRFAMVGIALLAMFSSIIVTLLISSRKLYALAAHGYYQKFLTKLNAKGIPVHAIVVCSLIVSLIILSKSVEFIAYLSNSSYFVSIIASALALIILRGKPLPFADHGVKIFRVPFYPISVYLVIIVSSILLFLVDRQSLLALGIWTVTGSLLYLIVHLRQ